MSIAYIFYAQLHNILNAKCTKFLQLQDNKYNFIRNYRHCDKEKDGQKELEKADGQKTCENWLKFEGARNRKKKERQSNINFNEINMVFPLEVFVEDILPSEDSTLTTFSDVD